MNLNVSRVVISLDREAMAHDLLAKEYLPRRILQLRHDLPQESHILFRRRLCVILRQRCNRLTTEFRDQFQLLHELVQLQLLLALPALLGQFALRNLSGAEFANDCRGL